MIVFDMMCTWVSTGKFYGKHFLGGKFSIVGMATIGEYTNKSKLLKFQCLNIFKLLKTTLTDFIDIHC